mgnify:CR=1 FL=1
MRRSVAEMIVRDPEKYAHHDRVFLNNPVVMQGMGLAPLVVLATTGKNALMLAVSVVLLLTPSRMLACLLSRAFPLRDEQPAKEELEKKLLPRGLIYSGSADLERVRLALAAAFATLPREEVRAISAAEPHIGRETVQYVEDAMDVTQGKLGMGFSCGSSDMPALLMGNTLFGGSSNSKLFLNVREKLSLCYYASSLYHRQKGLITVSSGIEFQNYQKAYDEIMAQLEAVQKGQLEDWELEGARSTLLNSYATVGDSQGKLENFYLGQAATGQHETPADLARAIQDMTAERICRAMSTVKLDTVYFLKGKEGEA